MARRSYEQHCGLAHALDVVGERWTMLLVRELELGPKRFSALASALPGMARNLLADRLRFLEQEGVVAHVGPSYELTALGRELRPALEALAVWGLLTLPARPAGRTTRASWMTLTMRAGGDPTAAQDWHATVELRVDGEVLSVRLDDGDVHVVEGRWPTRPDVVIVTDYEAYAELGLRLEALGELCASGRVQITGDAALAVTCFQVLRLPEYPAMRSNPRVNDETEHVATG